MSQEEKPLSFENALTALEEIIGLLESGELSLEEALTLYERGQSLAIACQTQLENATLRVSQLNADGAVVPATIE